MTGSTIYPRIQVITSPPVRAALMRIKAITGQSMGGITRELLDEALPALEAMADALEAVPANPGQALARMSHLLQEAQGRAAQMDLALPGKPTLVQHAVQKAKKDRAKARRLVR